MSRLFPLKALCFLVPALIVGGLMIAHFMQPQDVQIPAAPSKPEMVRIGNEGKCGATVYASTVDELAKVGIHNWVAACEEAERKTAMKSSPD